MHGHISRVIFWNIETPGAFPTEQVVLYALTLGAFLLLIRALIKGGFITRLKVIFKATGSETNRLDNLGARLWHTILDVFAHTKLLKEPYQGTFHILILWGFIILFLGAMIDFFQVDIIEPIFKVHFMEGDIYLAYSVITDLAGVMVLVGLCMALARRYFFKPDWLDDKPEDKFILWLILAIIVTGFFLEGMRMAATERQPGDPMNAYTWYSFGGMITSYLFAWMSVSALKTTHMMMWWGHTFIVLGFIVYVGYSKLLHIFITPVNVFLRNTAKNPAPIRVMPPEMFENAETFGIHKLEEFSWKDLFDSEACVRCGRCVQVCPAFNTDKPLKPRDVIQDIRSYMETKAKFAMDVDGVYRVLADEEYTGPALIGDTLDKHTIWACTTCMACVEACPCYIQQFPKLIDLRRYMVMMESDFPAEVLDVFKGMENNSNPWSIGAHVRADWAKGFNIPLMSEKGGAEWLFYVGCAGSFDDLNKKVAVAIAKLLQAAGVDFAILGTEEGCCGDSAKKIGNEYIYQALALANIETFKGYNVKKIITMCPHGFNTLKYDYKELGGDFEVYHYTEVLDKLIKEGKIKLNQPIADLGTITYHDSCYLGRYNKVYDQPRNIIRSLKSGNLVEMESNHAKSFCCGAGGGRMWMEEDLGTRINQKRTKEAEAAGAKTVCTACPFCFTMISDGIKELELSEKLQAFDIAQLVAKAAGIELKASEGDQEAAG
jgi:Fe-S oxidoreductase/nitrate reductase gamma subunit